MYIRQCLESIFTKENEGLSFEVIVVDDGTPDNSMAIVEEFTHIHPNLTVLHQKNQGQGPARDNGINHACGEYIWQVDSDDWIEPWAIKSLIHYINNYKDIDVFTVPATWIYEGNSKNWVDLKFERDTLMTGIEYQKENQMAAWQFVVRKSLLKEQSITYYPGILHEDGLWGGEVTYVTKKLLVISQPQYCYRQRQEGSVMHSIRIRSGYDIITIHKLLMKFMDTHVKEEHKVWWQKNHRFLNCYIYSILLVMILTKLGLNLCHLMILATFAIVITFLYSYGIFTSENTFSLALLCISKWLTKSFALIVLGSSFRKFLIDITINKAVILLVSCVLLAYVENRILVYLDCYYGSIKIGNILVGLGLMALAVAKPSLGRTSWLRAIGKKHSANIYYWQYIPVILAPSIFRWGDEFSLLIIIPCVMIISLLMNYVSLKISNGNNI